ncbi:Sporulation related domain protein [Pseudovibrio axinellae]|uniref:Sporulation related domain protein n=1 Tax=Pseudovibrio axinellae TaxID=989403 RepID=A0A165YQZ6_9HYPH|nr:SPOR domain-containing protein [Pseudovibrio axinellae]KZL19139.1 Sporulation related domain protein [Pseudovibrio axinellae]SER34510.1 Sporulation related domain-containing protein [Pseudovibrio axinellae]
MTNRSKYPEPGEVSARQTAGDEPQQWAGDQDPLVELARIVGESTAAAGRTGSRAESRLPERPLYPARDDHSAGGEADYGSDNAFTAQTNDFSVGAADAHEPSQTQDSFAALDAIFAAPKASAPMGQSDPFADLSAAVAPSGAHVDPVDYVSDLPPVPKAGQSPEPLAAAPVAPPVSHEPVHEPQFAASDEVSAEAEMGDILSRDLEESLVASLNQLQVEREQTPRPQQTVSRAAPELEEFEVADARPEPTLRERLERNRVEHPQMMAAEPVPEPVAPPAALAQEAASTEPKALNELSQNDYDKWRAERAAERASAAATQPVQAVAEPQLRGTHDDMAPVVADEVAFEPDLTAFAIDTGADLDSEPVSAPSSGQEALIQSKHLENALLAEFSLEEDLQQGAGGSAHELHSQTDLAQTIEESVDDIFADEIAQEPEQDPEPELAPGVAAELNEFERMSAGFETAAEEVDPFANEGDDAWQLDESVTNDSSLDEMSWPAAAEKLAQTEAAHQAALSSTVKPSDDQSPPPGGYDLDAVAQAMRNEDPSLDGGVLPQAVPRVSVDVPEDEQTTHGAGMRKGLMAASLIGAVVVVGGAGLFLFDFGGSGGDATPPPVIRADASPMKEVPAASDQPKNDQAKVFSPQEATQAASGEKMIQRENASVTPLPPASSDTDTAKSNVFEVNPPKKVRTVIVRPDGTIVQREGTGSIASADAQPRIVTSTVRNSNPQGATGTTTPAVAANTGQWAPLPGETQSASQQATPTSLQDAFANAPVASATETRNTLLGVSVVPQSKPYVVASATSGGVQSSQLAPLQAQPTSQVSNAPLNLTGSQGTQSASVNPQTLAPTPVPGDGVVGEIPGGTYIVQVASVRTVDQAQGQIRSYNRRYPNLMALVTPVITRADLGDKGVYYRIQVPFDGPTSANTFCGEFKASGGDCYVRRN